jgi:hypothetical protein
MTTTPTQTEQLLVDAHKGIDALIHTSRYPICTNLRDELRDISRSLLKGIDGVIQERREREGAN